VKLCRPWASGDVIGVCLDLEKGELSFSKNGVNMGGELSCRGHAACCGSGKAERALFKATPCMLARQSGCSIHGFL